MASAPISSVKACVFDAYGTMFDVHSPTARAAEAMGGKAEAVSRLWRQKQLEYTWLRSLMGAHADFWQVTGDALDYALESHGIDDGTLHDKLMQLYLTLDAYADVKPALEQLRAKGLETGILSNGNPRMLSAAVESAGIASLLDAVLSIEDAGIYKPDARVYQLAVDRFGVRPDEICFVSTNAWDAAAAAHFGFQVAWMNRFGMARERLPGDLRVVITGLDALPSQIG
jgi:2-haloacid dehalogenase